jgi:hypothetical protein
MNCLRPLKHWDLGFESHLRHECLCAFILFVLSCVQVAALRRADPPSKESYRLCKILLTDLINALPGNSSVNMVQHATIDKAVFYVVRTEQRWNNGIMQPVSKQRLGENLRVSGDVINNRDGVFRGVCAECI